MGSETRVSPDALVANIAYGDHMSAEPVGGSRLLSQVLDLSRQLRDEVPDLRSELTQIEERAEAPLRVSIAGKIKAGKSTLLNALIGERLAAVDAAECTKVVTWYEYGEALKAEGERVDGFRGPLETSIQSEGFEIDLGDRTFDEYERLVVTAPLDPLRSMTMIDTPGTASLSTDVTAKSLDFLTPCLLYTSPSPRDQRGSRMPSSA